LFVKFDKIDQILHPQKKHSSVIQKKLKHREPRNYKNAGGSSSWTGGNDTRPNFKGINLLS
jgi:hypothetical protein